MNITRSLVAWEALEQVEHMKELNKCLWEIVLLKGLCMEQGSRPGSFGIGYGQNDTYNVLDIGAFGDGGATQVLNIPQGKTYLLKPLKFVGPCNANKVQIELIGIVYSKTTFDVVKFGAVGDGQTDDSEAFVNAWKALCGAAAAGDDVPTLTIPGGKTFLLQPSEFEGPCKSKSVHVQVSGNLMAPKTPDAWKVCPSYSWLSFRNVDHLILDGSGKIDGQGSAWWSKALQFHRCDHLRLSGLTHINSPRSHIGIGTSNDVDISHLTIIAPDESPNTDGINVANSTYVYIHDSKIGTGDDCIAISSGASNVRIAKIACGPGHGISVGSLGANGAYAAVENVYVRDCSFNGTQNGARIKTWPGGSGYARNITFENITLTATKNPIIIDQQYCNGAHDCAKQSKAVLVSNVRFTDFRGTCGNEEAIKLDCNHISGCQNIELVKINITSTVPSKKVYASCNNAKGNSGSTVPTVSCLKYPTRPFI
ncbi:probable polygalacturonase At3g15720 [Prunus dulcis]|uniref:probable polygalacturonase At3g15720 n=1 Tax=Prunus dulcis TaxID=3755 RepID=UPI0014825BBE|nr:probable polygalacturonase At3g15720 [Prunus dulcis]